MDIFQQFFGDSQRQQDYDDFLNRAQNDPDSISDQEAAQRYRELMRQAPPELVEEANQEVYSRLPTDMRSQMARSFQNAHNNPNSSFQGFDYNDPDEAADPRNLSRLTQRANDQDPDLFGQIAGSPIGRAAMAAGAAYLASRMLGGGNRSVGGLGGLGGMGGLGGLGGMGGGMGGLGGLGGLGGGSGMGGMGGTGGDVLGTMLGRLLGGSGTSHRR